ncbi:MAG: hypothetical protein OEW34_08550, partial [Burkholderiaceae bacterium]|nr:hypothetical protein [Burkholderiaceae bacterium]
MPLPASCCDCTLSLNSFHSAGTKANRRLRPPRRTPSPATAARSASRSAQKRATGRGKQAEAEPARHAPEQELDGFTAEEREADARKQADDKESRQHRAGGGGRTREEAREGTGRCPACIQHGHRERRSLRRSKRAGDDKTKSVLFKCNLAHLRPPACRRFSGACGTPDRT